METTTNVARWVGIFGMGLGALSAGLGLGACGGYSSLGEVSGSGGGSGSGMGGAMSMGARSGNDGAMIGGDTGMGNTGNTAGSESMGMGATGMEDAGGTSTMGMGNVGDGAGTDSMGNVGNTGGSETMGMGNVGNTGGSETMGTSGTSGTLTEPSVACMSDNDCAWRTHCATCSDGVTRCTSEACLMGTCENTRLVCDPPVLATGCASEGLAMCNPGFGQTCGDTDCAPGAPYPNGFLERGDGVLCKFMPNAAGPDFACMQGEWCHFGADPQCRCGFHEGCQVGEQCEVCQGAGCLEDTQCIREHACNVDNLDSCGSTPGRTCGNGALTCIDSPHCPDMAAGAGATQCAGSPGGCCSKGEWCFDDKECRCGTHPACDASHECRPNSIGFYECQST